MCPLGHRWAPGCRMSQKLSPVVLSRAPTFSPHAELPHPGYRAAHRPRRSGPPHLSWKMTGPVPGDRGRGGSPPLLTKESTGLLPLPGSLGPGGPPGLALASRMGPRRRWRGCACLCQHPAAREGQRLLTTSFRAAAVTGWQLGQSKNKAGFESLYIRPSGRPPSAVLIVHIWGQDFTEFPLIPHYEVPALPTLGRPRPGRAEVGLRERSEVCKFHWLRNSWSKVDLQRTMYDTDEGLGAPPPSWCFPNPGSPGGLLKPLRVQCEGHRSRPGCTWRLGCKLSSETHALTHSYSGI